MLGVGFLKMDFILLLSLLVIDIAILGSWFGLDEVAERFNNTVLQDGLRGRGDLNQFTFLYWQDYLITGSGLGSFKEHFQAYQGVVLGPEFHFSHNDYLQMGAEIGFIGLVLLGLPVTYNLALVLRGMYRRKRPLIQGATFTTIMSAIALALHSTVDYNLQITSNAATFMAILAMGLAACYLPKRYSSNARIPLAWRPEKAIEKGGIMVLILAAGLFVSSSFKWSRSSLQLEQIQNLTRYQKEEGMVTDRALRDAELKLLQMIENNPENPSISEELGVLYTQMAQRLEPDSEEAKQYYRLALSAFERAIKQQAVDAFTWSNVVLLKAFFKEYDQTLFNAMESAIAAGSWRPYPITSVAKTGLLLWPVLPQASRNLVVSTFDKALKIVPVKAKKWSIETAVKEQLCTYSGKHDEIKNYCDIPRSSQ